MTIKAVLFDLDGTLLDTLQDIANAANTALAALGCRPYEIEWYRNSIGNGLQVLMQRAVPLEAQAQDNMTRAVQLFRDYYARNCAVHTKPYPGIVELLDELSARGIKLAVLSNKRDEFTKHLVSEFFPDTHFEAVLGEQPGVPAKPHPAGVQLAAQALGSSGAEVLYLGDSAVDMQTARAVDMFAVGALWGFRSRHELEQGGAQALVSAPQEVLAFIS